MQRQDEKLGSFWEWSFLAARSFDREREIETRKKKKEGIFKSREMQEKLWLHRAVSNKTVVNSHSYVV